MYPRDHLRRFVLATGNVGKLRELREILSPLCIEVLSQQDFAAPEVAETGLSFVENAILKARSTAAHCQLPALADDSGLEVDALDGRPGIYSARFAGVAASDKDNIKKLLEELRDIPEAERSARFQCVLVFMRHASDPTPLICQGTWEGRILFTPQGDNGFGYDPVFYVPDQGCSAAQLAAGVKNRLSHRAQALQEFKQRLGLELIPTLE